MAVKVTKDPDKKVTGLSLTRNGTVFTASWKVPNNMVDSNSKSRATSINADFELHGPYQEFFAQTYHFKDAKTSSASFDINNLNGLWNRTFYYPFTYYKATHCDVSVYGENSEAIGPRVNASYWFGTPRTPTVAAISVNASNGVLSTTVTTDAGTDNYERYDTKYEYEVYRSATGRWERGSGTSTATSIPLSYDAKDYQGLSYADYIMYRVRAYARGIAGDSSWSGWSTYYMSYPAQATVRGIGVMSNLAGSNVIVRIDTNSTTEHPVDKVSLQVLQDVTYKTASSIPLYADWKSVSAVDNAQCTALACPISEAAPSPGRYSWVRVVTVHAVENTLVRTSEPVRLEALEVPPPSAADDPIKLVSLEQGGDGESMVATMVWNADGNDDSTGTELSWASDEGIWRSTQQPEIHEFEWTDGPMTVEGKRYQDSAVIEIRGLQQGQPVYVRARRYMDSEDGRSYGPYSGTVADIPSVAPSSVVMSCPSYVAAGDPVPCTWSYSGGSVQKAWRLMRGDDLVIAESEDMLGYFEISPERADAVASDGEFDVRVEVSTGGAFMASESRTVRIAEPPTMAVASLGVSGVLKAQPLGFAVECDTPAQIMARVWSHGSSGSGPQGDIRQPYGYVVWSDLLTPDWSDGAAAIVLPEGVGFIDGAEYTLEVTAIDAETGLSSETQSADFSVRWSHKAQYPEDAVTLEPYDETDEDGNRRTGVAISLHPGTMAEDVETGGEMGDGYFKSLVVDGKSEQDSTTGKNLFYGYKSEEYTVSGITFMPNADGSITIKGTNNSDAYANNSDARLDVQAGSTFTISQSNAASTNVGASVYIYDSSSEILAFFEVFGNGSKTYTIPTGAAKISCRCVVRPRSTVDEKVYIQLEEGSQATEYEPYTGGMPSPNPDYPQEIRSVGGRNLSNVSKGVNNIVIAHVVPGETYTFSALFSSNCGYNLRKNTLSGEKIAGLNDTNIGRVYTTFTADEEFDLLFNGWSKSDISVLDAVSNIQLERGSVATPYVPYGAIGVRIQGKNLAEVASIMISGIDHRLCQIKAGTYTLSCVQSGTRIYSTSNLSIRLDGERITSIPVTDTPSMNRVSATFTVDRDGILTVFPSNVNPGSDGSMFVDIQLELGSEATAYAPYHENVVAIDLQGNELHGLPDGTRDEITVDAAGHVEIVKRVGEVKLAISDMDNAEDYPGWKTTAMEEIIKETNQFVLQHGVDCMNNIGGYVSVNPNNHVVFLSKGIYGGRTQSEWISNYSDLILDVLAKYTEPQTIDLGYIDLPEVHEGDTVSVLADIGPETHLTYRTDGFEESDVYDVYRMAGGVATLIGEGLPLDYEGRDDYAPYGEGAELSYRVVSRTQDGDFEPIDVEYELEGDFIRLDSAVGYLVLPWGHDESDSFSKDARVTKHLAGNTEAFYNEGVTRKGSLSARIITVDGMQDVLTAELIARHPGNVFVRTPRGSAYEAVVDVSPLTHKGPTATIALSAQEVSTSRAFMLEVPGEDEGEE